MKKVFSCKWGKDIREDEPDEYDLYTRYIKALIVIKEDAGYFEPEFNASEQRYYAVYDHWGNGFDIKYDWSSNEQIPGVVYFKDVDDLLISFQTHRAEWVTLLGYKEIYG